MQQLIFATHNAGKLREVRQILAPLNIDVLSAADLNLPDIPETGKTFEENALLKATAIQRLTGLPTLADDSGLCIRALDDRPGLYSARFAKEHGGYPAVFDKLNELLADKNDRSAYFICVMALVLNDNTQHVFTGRVDGTILHEPSGIHGFGYDPVFQPDGYTETMAALGDDVKNKISHRAKALTRLFAFLNTKQ